MKIHLSLISFLLLSFAVCLIFPVLSCAFSIKFFIGKDISMRGIRIFFPFILGMLMLMIGLSQKPLLDKKNLIIIEIIFSISAMIMLMPFLEGNITNGIGKIILFFVNKTYTIPALFYTPLQSIIKPLPYNLSNHTNDMGTYFLFGLNLPGILMQAEKIKKLFVKSSTIN